MASYWVYQRRPHSVVRYRHGGYTAIYPWTSLHYERGQHVSRQQRIHHNQPRNNIVKLRS